MVNKVTIWRDRLPYLGTAPFTIAVTRSKEYFPMALMIFSFLLRSIGVIGPDLKGCPSEPDSESGKKLINVKNI